MALYKKMKAERTPPDKKKENTMKEKETKLAETEGEEEGDGTDCDGGDGGEDDE